MTSSVSIDTANRAPGEGFDVRQVIDAIARVAGGTAALHEPCLAGREWDLVRDCLDSGWVSTVGAYVDRFEKDLAAYTGARHAVAVVNGTAALHVALELAGVRPGDEVLAPALTFVATANAIAYCGAIPHFFDAEESTLGIDIARLDDYLRETTARETRDLIDRRTGRRIGALVCMHTYGHPVDLDRLAETCQQYGLPLVEDAAESLGSFYKGRHTGTHGLLATLSFNGNKIVTTGGGGAILTNDSRLAATAKHVTTTAKLPHAWEFVHDRIGYNYRLPNLNAALGCAQLEQLPGFIERKRRLAALYQAAFAGIPGVRFVAEPAYARSNYWLNTIVLDGAEHRDTLLRESNERGLMTRPAWTPMHRLPMFASCPRMDLAVVDDLSGRAINLPSSAFLPLTPDAGS